METMSGVVTLQDATEHKWVETKSQQGDPAKGVFPLADGVVYSKRKNFRPFSTPPLEAYASVLGEEKMERLQRVAEQLKGLKLLELNATAQGGGVAEMLYSSVPFLNALGIEDEWKIISGSREFFECTKSLHNLSQLSLDITEVLCYNVGIKEIKNEDVHYQRFREAIPYR